MNKSKGWALGLLFPAVTLALACAGRSVTPASDSPAHASRLETTDFNGAKAYEHVRHLVELGPRPVGSAAHDKMRDYIIDQLKTYGLTVMRDDFPATTPLGEKAMTNIIGILPGTSENFMMVGGHYDTKYFREAVFVGANDGGSSAGALLEIARTMAQGQKPAHTTWFVFLDGEEAFCFQWSECLNGQDHTYGSRHLAEKMTKDGTLAKARGLVLIDMIGDRDLGILRELGYSTPSMNNIIWNTAAALGYGRYFLRDGYGVEDDHVPFLRAGLPAADLIDFQYGPGNDYWHTQQDTLDKISGDSMKVVGDVVIRSLPELFNALITGKR